MVGRLLRLQLALAAAALVAAGAASASVLYVGDSLGVGTSPYLHERLGNTALDVDARIGRPSSVGVDVLAARIDPDYDVVVFDLGTNDDPAAPEALTADLQRARQLAGDRCLVVATLNRPPLNGVPVDGLNRAVSSFAAQDPNVSLVDWHAAAASDPGLLVDGVHTDAQGYELRAGLFADAIRTCGGTFGGGAPASGAELEHEDGSLPPAASAGRQTDGRERDRRPGPRAGVEQLATAVGRAVGTGTEFG